MELVDDMVEMLVIWILGLGSARLEALEAVIISALVASWLVELMNL